MADRVRQREWNAVYLLRSTMRGLHLNSHSAGRCLEFSTASSRHCPPPIPQTTMTLNHQHFTNTKRCGTALSFSPLHATPPSLLNACARTHTHTYNTCLPLSYLCISRKAYGYRHPIPSVESSLSLYRSSQRGQTTANRNIVWELTFLCLSWEMWETQ